MPSTPEDRTDTKQEKTTLQRIKKVVDNWEDIVNYAAKQSVAGEIPSEYIQVEELLDDLKDELHRPSASIKTPKSNKAPQSDADERWINPKLSTDDRWINIDPRNNRLVLRFRVVGFKKQFYLVTGLEDTPANRDLLRSLRDEIQDDIFSGDFDDTLQRYKEGMPQVNTRQEQQESVSATPISNTPLSTSVDPGQSTYPVVHIIIELKNR